MSANLLWAHLLHKDAATTDTPSQIPPIAPQDKTGTSMRMLIHDTQVNLEKFSARLDGLLQRVDECRAQVVNANKLLDVERDKVLAEMRETANRCQAEMKAHVGTPAQAAVLDVVRVSQASTDNTVQALEKRIDALQTLFQTHTHAMQSIQEQHNALMGTILPLVPILHGISPQMEQIKTVVSDMVANAVSTLTRQVENMRSVHVAEIDHGHARSSTQLGSSSRAVSSSRRKRSNASVLGLREANVSPSSPLDGHGFKRARLEGTAHHASDPYLPQGLSRLTVPPTNPGDPPPLLQTPRTPRQPLANLLFPPGNDTWRIRQHTVGSRSHEYMRSLETLPAVGGPQPRISRSPFQPLNNARSRLRDTTASSPKAPDTTAPSDQDALSKAIKMEELLEPNLSGIISIHSSPLSSPPTSLQPETGDPRSEVAQGYDHDAEVPPPPSDPTWHHDTSPPKSMSLRDRRAQMSRIGRSEMRRFIPLVPWSDEEE